MPRAKPLSATLLLLLVAGLLSVDAFYCMRSSDCDHPGCNDACSEDYDSSGRDCEPKCSVENWMGTGRVGHCEYGYYEGYYQPLGGGTAPLWWKLGSCPDPPDDYDEAPADAPGGSDEEEEINDDPADEQISDEPSDEQTNDDPSPVEPGVSDDRAGVIAGLLPF